ncbi:hypothetical protein GIB67_024473, partial [Kingdonia uniflora]
MREPEMEVIRTGDSSIPNEANDYIYENEYGGDFGQVGPGKSLVLSSIEYEHARKWVIGSHPHFDDWKSRHNDFLKHRKTAGKRKSGHVRAEFTESDDLGFHDIVRGPLAFVTRLMDSNTTTGNDTLGSVGGAKKMRGPSRGQASLPDGRKRNVSVSHLGQPNGVDEDTITFVTNVGYKMPLVSDDYLKKKIESSWRLIKSRLRIKYIIGHDPADVKARPTPPLVPDDDWYMFVDICNSVKHMASNARNKVNWSKQKVSICVRRRNLPFIRHMLAMKRKLNFDALVARSEVHHTAHTKRDNTVQCPKLVEKIMAIERLEPHLKFASVDDSLEKVLHCHLNIECTLNSQKDRRVARGMVVAVAPYTLIHNVLLRDGFYKILLSKVMKPRTLLSKDDEYSEDLGDAGEGACVAWAICCLDFEYDLACRKLVMLYLKEEDEKKIGDFERREPGSGKIHQQTSMLIMITDQTFLGERCFTHVYMRTLEELEVGEMTWNLLLTPYFFFYVDVCLGKDTSKVHTLDTVNQIVDLDEDGWELKDASSEKVEVSSIKTVETTTTTITSDNMIQDYVKLEKQKEALPLSIFSDSELYSDDSLHGQQYVVALGEIYSAVEVFRASTRLFKAWILSTHADPTNIFALLEECDAIWPGSRLEDALMSISDPVSSRYEGTIKDLVESIKFVHALNGHDLQIHAFSLNVPICRFSLLPPTVVQSIKT